MDFSKTWISQGNLDRILAACPAEHRPSVRGIVNVYPPARDRGWDWLDRPVDVAAAWDRLVDAEQLREFRERAFWLCVRDGGCERHGRYGWASCGAAAGARQNGKRALADRFLEECRERNIPVTVASALQQPDVEPEPVGVDVYMPSAWLDGPSFFDRIIERAAARAYEDERRHWLNQYQPQSFFQWRGGNPVEDLRRATEAYAEEFVQEPDHYRRYFENRLTPEEER